MSQDEQRLHLALASEKVAAARELLAEGFLRDAASRAYYGMYHAAYALARTKGHAPKTHSGLAHVLAMEFVRTGILSREEFNAFREAQRVREAGDYDVTFPLEDGDVRAIIDRASEFVSAVEAKVG